MELENREGRSEFMGVASPAASNIEASVMVATPDLSERVVELPPAAAMGVTSAENGDAWPPNMLAVSPKPGRRLRRGAGQAWCRASVPDDAAVVEPVPTDIGVLDADISGQKLAGVIIPIGVPVDIAVGVGSRLLPGCARRFLSASGANGHTLVRQAVDATWLGVNMESDVGEAVG